VEEAVILEVAILNIRPGNREAFESSFAEAVPLIAASDGYIDHELSRCLEMVDRYILLVRWNSLEDHTVGFKGSAAYQAWKELLHHHYDPAPSVEHYESCL
jgi:heme-degrading monooxygenase HmoA